MERALDANNPEEREKLRRLFRVKKTEGEMLARRGYRLDIVDVMKSDRSFVRVNLSGLQDPALQLPTLLEFREKYGLFRSRQEFSSIYYHAQDPKIKVLVLYLGNDPGKQVGTKDFNIFHEFIQAQARIQDETQRIRHFILITETGLNSEKSSFIANRILGYKVEVFLDVELAFNKTKHALAPIETVHIPARMVKWWAQEEQFQPEKAPMVLNVDANAKWYGAEPMDGFQHIIMGTTTDTAVYYRICRQATTK